MRLAGAVLAFPLGFPLGCLAQQPHEQEIQRALILQDQRSAEFARGAPPAPLDPRVGLPLHPDPNIARELRPYERQRAAREREAHVLRLPPPIVRGEEKPLPLPGGPRPGVDPVAAPRVSD
jgi:hypothetical protein